MPSKAEEIASAPGGGAPAEQMRQTGASASSNDKMENDLEMSKANKQEMNDATDVAGRKSKGTSLVDKLVPGKGGNKDAGAEGKTTNTTGLGNLDMNAKE